jgi:periplasmic protein TonB
MQANSGLRFPTQPGRLTPHTTVVGLSVLLHAALLAVLVVIAGAPRQLPTAPVETTIAMVFQPATPALAPVSRPEPPQPPPAVQQVPPPPTPEPPPPLPEPAPAMAPPPVEQTPAPPVTVAPPPVTVAQEPAHEVTHPVTPEHHAAPPRPNPPRPHPRRPSAPATTQPSEHTELASLTAGPPAAIVPPRAVAGLDGNLAPSYPESARRRGEQGRVMLRVTVSTEGSPMDVSVAGSSGYPILDDAAVNAVRRWRFTPATQAGRPLVATAEVPVVFHLTE